MVILGDAVHSDEAGCEDKMETSMLMMDLIFRLKLKFPHQVFYRRRNYDSSSADISKQGVPQGVLWEHALHETRGSRYVRAMARLYDLLPYVALSRWCVACHAGAPTRKFSRDTLIDIRQHSRLEKEINHVLLQRPNSPGGYNGGDVKRMRARLELDPDTPLIVGHTPRTADNTCGLMRAASPITTSCSVPIRTG